MYGLFFALALALQTWSAASDIPAKTLGKHPAPEDIVARVNGQDVKAKDVEDLLWQWRGSEVTADLLDYLLVRQEAQKQGVIVAEAEIGERMAIRMKQYEQQLPQGLNAEDALLSQGFGDSRLYLRVKRELMLEKLALRDFKVQDYVRVSALAFKPKSEQAGDVGKAIHQANEAYESLTKGAKWEEIYATSTSDPTQLASNGQIGWKNLQAFPMSVADEIKTLNPGGYTKPAQTSFGIQVFRVDTKGAAATGKDLAELRSLYLGQAMKALEKKLRDAAKVEPYRPGKKLSGL